MRSWFALQWSRYSGQVIDPAGQGVGYSGIAKPAH